MASRGKIRLCVLGTFQLEENARPIHLPRRKVEALLAYLTLHPEPQPREKIAALFWGDSPDTQARHSLRTALATLRQHLGGDILLSEQDAIQLNPSISLWVDARAFEPMANRKWQIANGEEAMRHLQSAIALYRGDLLADFYDDWILPERERYRHRYLDALLCVTQALRSQSEYDRAIEFAQKAIAADPSNERACQHLMFCDLMVDKKEAALKEYERCVRVLRDELAAEPTQETTALYHWIKQSGEGKSLEARITNLPIPVSSFIGRKHETANIKRLVSENRLVTLTGAGGSGKTRLSIQVATDLIDAFKDGVWWVELAALTDESLVPQSIAKALGVHEAQGETLNEMLARFLREKQLLIVLDNCEHLIAACAQIAAALLQSAQDVKIFATSREALGIPGEIIFPVPTLGLPDPQRLSLIDLLMEYESIRLFVERAKAVHPKFSLTPENALVVAQICQRLDGIPLALELAAARVRVLSVEHIAERLNDRFNLLTTGNRAALPRQQTLRATIDWSYDLLRDDARMLFRRLAVFEGGFTLDAVENICCDAPLAPNLGLDLLTRLVDRSLVIAEENGQRYRMLETIQEYAREKITEDRELDGLKKSHFDYFLQFAEKAESELRGRKQSFWLAQLEGDYANFRAALEWSRSNTEHSDSLLRLASALSIFWFRLGYLTEGRAYLNLALKTADHLIRQSERPPGAAKPPAAIGMTRIAQAKALHGAGMLARAQGDFGSADLLLSASVTMSRELGDKFGLANSLRELGFVAINLFDSQRAQSLLEESLALSIELGDNRGRANTHLWLGTAARYSGDLNSARALYEKSIALHRDEGMPIAWPLYQLGFLSAIMRDYRAATNLLQQSLTLCHQTGEKRGAGEALAALGDLSRWQGNIAEAERNYIQALELQQGLGIQWAVVWCLYGLGQVALLKRDHDRAVELFRDGLTIEIDEYRKVFAAICLAGITATLNLDDTASSTKAIRLLGAAISRLDLIGSQMLAAHGPEFAEQLASLKAQIDARIFAEEFDIGRAMALPEAIEYAFRTN